MQLSNSQQPPSPSTTAAFSPKPEHELSRTLKPVPSLIGTSPFLITHGGSEHCLQLTVLVVLKEDP